MKYCQNCGRSLEDDAVFCSHCGVNQNAVYTTTQTNSSPSTLKVVAKIFMIISTVIMGFCIFPLAWCLPMTIIYSKKVENHEPIGIGFKICCLLFVSTVAGILMLVDQED